VKSELSSLQPLHAFVTGATGLLGNNLVRALLAKGYRVTALARSSDKAAAQFGDLPVRCIVGDLADVRGFATGLEGVDVLFHAAAYFRDSYKGGNHRQRLLDTNVRATRELLHEAHSRGVRRMVHVSSIAVLDGPPGTAIDESMSRNEIDADDYYLSKILAERAIGIFLDQHPDFWAAFVLPGWMHGPGDAGPTSAGQFLLDFLHSRLPGIPPGTVSFVDARDVAAAVIAVNERGARGERYLAAGRHMSMLEVMAAIERVSHVKSPTRRVPLFVLRAIACVAEVSTLVTHKPAVISAATAKLMAREAGRTQFDHAKSKRVLGIEFRAVEDTLRDEIEWYRAWGWLAEKSRKGRGH
jgi:dihydroflavonol-4-reductase